MTAPLTDIARAKINLTLRVIGRRADGYHDLESLVVFAGIADRLSLEPSAEVALAEVARANVALTVSGPFAVASGPTGDNLVLKAVTALGRGVAGLKAGHFDLTKNIPVAAGIGGGSADAAAALRLLAQLNGLARDDARLMTAALQVGADVPVCLEQRACIMAGVGERLSPPLDLPALPAVLVNPGVGLSTRDVFKAYAAELADKPGRDVRLGPVPRDAQGLLAWLKDHGNDLTAAAIACAPVVGDVMAALAAVPGVQLARMSGSGATCFALFGTAEAADAAARQIKAAHPAWWAQATTFG